MNELFLSLHIIQFANIIIELTWKVTHFRQLMVAIYGGLFLIFLTIKAYLISIYFYFMQHSANVQKEVASALREPVFHHQVIFVIVYT